MSLWADEAPRALGGRSPLECYGDFMAAFRDAFLDDIGGAIEEVVVGAGPCGELRYPSYVEANGWRFPGVRPGAMRNPNHARRPTAGAPGCSLGRYCVLCRSKRLALPGGSWTPCVC